MEDNRTPTSGPASPELRDLYTQMAGATDLHETRKTEQAVEIGPPVSPNPGPYDVRTGKYKNRIPSNKQP